MKNFEQLIKECLSDLESIGIKIGKVTKYSINTRAKSRWGQCKQVCNGIFEINISAQLLQDNISDQAAKDTILHEMLHTIDGCMGHKGKWKELAQKVNKELPQYTIKRVTSSAEKGIETKTANPKTQTKATSKPKPKTQKGNMGVWLFLLIIVGLFLLLEIIYS
ncbi:MAG: SprT-like domain-containing protein [Clostridia bacterium]|nr:SprT-like domain-containing protein [Clostridia bacterium]